MLVAIAIPIFNTQLEKSRDATSVSNIRAAYAEASAALLTWNGKDATSDGLAISESGNVTTVVVPGVAIKSQVADNWSGQATELPFAAPSDSGANADVTLSFAYNSSTDSWSVS